MILLLWPFFSFRARLVLFSYCLEVTFYVLKLWFKLKCCNPYLYVVKLLNIWRNTLKCPYIYAFSQVQVHTCWYILIYPPFSFTGWSECCVYASFSSEPFSMGHSSIRLMTIGLLYPLKKTCYVKACVYKLTYELLFLNDYLMEDSYMLFLFYCAESK